MNKTDVKIHYENIQNILSMTRFLHKHLSRSLSACNEKQLPWPKIQHRDRERLSKKLC